MPYPKNFSEQTGLTSICRGWFSLQRPCELLPQSTDEIFSITIPASLREDGVTDLYLLSCAGAVVSLDIDQWHFNLGC